MFNVNCVADEPGAAPTGSKGKGKARTVKKKIQKGQVANPEDQYNIGRLAWHKAVGKLLTKWKINGMVDEVIERYGRLPLQIMAARGSREVRCLCSVCCGISIGLSIVGTRLFAFNTSNADHGNHKQTVRSSRIRGRRGHRRFPRRRRIFQYCAR